MNQKTGQYMDIAALPGSTDQINPGIHKAATLGFIRIMGRGGKELWCTAHGKLVVTNSDPRRFVMQCRVCGSGVWLPDGSWQGPPLDPESYGAQEKT